jgi:uncharacterized protein YegL
MSDAMATPRRPGGQMASRPLHFIWMIDGSGSMGVQGKMAALNQAMHDAIFPMRAVARENPQAALYVNAIRFGDDAQWMVERLTPVSEFRWQDMEASGVTALGEALTMVGDVLQPPLIRGRALPPILALVTDGLPTDDFQAGLAHLLEKPWGRRSVRVAVALGEDAMGVEPQEFLRAFSSDQEKPPLQANNPETLAKHLRWISTAVVKSVCAPDAVKGHAAATGNGKAASNGAATALGGFGGGAIW